MILVTGLLVLFALGESIGRLGDLNLAKQRPELFEEGSFHLHYAKHSLIMYIHVIAGMIFLLSGVYQLIPRFRKWNIGLHRVIGRVFLLISLIVSISAIVLGVFLPYGDWLESIANLIFGVFILIATIKSYTTIKAKKIVEHSNWVRRIFFVALSIATIRIIMIVNVLVTNETIQQVMGRSFLIGFILHALLTEIWISKNSKPISG